MILSQNTELSCVHKCEPSSLCASLNVKVGPPPSKKSVLFASMKAVQKLQETLFISS